MSDAPLVTLTVTGPRDPRGCDVKARSLGGNRYELQGMPHCSGGIYQYDVVETAIVPGYAHRVVTHVLERGSHATYALDYTGVADKRGFVKALQQMLAQGDPIGAQRAQSGQAWLSVRRANAPSVIARLKQAYPGLQVTSPGDVYRSVFDHTTRRSANPLAMTDPGVLRLFPWMK